MRRRNPVRSCRLPFRRSAMNRARWLDLMSKLGLPPNEETFDALLKTYSETHRHYHTVEHIDHCLRELDAEISLAREPAEVELALWFHDAVYNSHRSDNEQKSAELACALLERSGDIPRPRGVSPSSARSARVYAHIIATRNKHPRQTQTRNSWSTSTSRASAVLKLSTLASKRTSAINTAGYRR